SVGHDEDVVGALAKIGIACSGRENAAQIAHGRDDVRLANRAGAPYQVTEGRRRALTEPREVIRRRRLDPAAAGGHPARRREVVAGDDGLDAVLAARGAHAAIVLERSAREFAGLGLDPAPFEREPVGAEAELGAEPDVGGIAMPVIAGVAARLLTRRIHRM